MQISLHLYIVGSGEKVKIGGRARQHHNKPSCWAFPPLKLDDTLPDDDDLSMNSRPPVPLSPFPPCSYPSFIKLPWLDVAPGDCSHTAMWSEFSHPLSPSPIRLPLLTQPSLSGCIHTYIHVQTQEEEEGGGASRIFTFIQILFQMPHYFSRYSAARRTPSPLYLLKKKRKEISPKVRGVDHFSSPARAAWAKVTANFPFNMDAAKNNKCCSNKTAFSCRSGIFDLAYQSVWWWWWWWAGLGGEHDPRVAVAPKVGNAQTYFGWMRLAGCSSGAAHLPKWKKGLH